MASYLTAAEVADRWHISERHVQHIAATGDLRAAKLAGQWRFQLVDVEAYERARTTGPSHDPTRATAASPTPRRTIASCDVGAEYEPVFAGPVPWRSTVIDEARPASRRAAGKTKAASVRT